MSRSDLASARQHFDRMVAKTARQLHVLGPDVAAGRIPTRILAETQAEQELWTQLRDEIDTYLATPLDDLDQEPGTSGEEDGLW